MKKTETKQYKAKNGVEFVHHTNGEREYRHPPKATKNGNEKQVTYHRRNKS